jgi:hypothetical protein
LSLKHDGEVIISENIKENVIIISLNTSRQKVFINHLKRYQSDPASSSSFLTDLDNVMMCVRSQCLAASVKRSSSVSADLNSCATLDQCFGAAVGEGVLCLAKPTASDDCSVLFEVWRPRASRMQCGSVQQAGAQADQCAEWSTALYTSTPVACPAQQSQAIDCLDVMRRNPSTFLDIAAGSSQAADVTTALGQCTAQNINGWLSGH